MKNISKESLLAVPVPRPPSAVQARLGTAFEKFDQLLTLLHERAQAHRKLQRGLMQQLLTGQRRLPDFRGRPWHSSRLADHVATVTRRNTNGLPLVLTASGEIGLVDQRRYFNRSVAGADLTKYYLLRKGEFAYNRSAMKGYPYGATKRLDEHEEGALSTLYLCFAISDPNLHPDFLKHVFESRVLNRQLRPIVRVGARAHGLLNVTEDDYLSISIPLPELDEQRRIAEVLNDSDREIDLLTALCDQIALQKRALLSKLLSGEIPVPA
jgi:type I restriction enzyme S subunit